MTSDNTTHKKSHMRKEGTNIRRKQPQQQYNAPSVPFGAEGLYVCGYEYRQVAATSNRHHDGPDNGDDQPRNSQRLFHKATGVMITADNRQTYVPDGQTFDTVSLCCQQYAQQTLQDRFNLTWVNLFDYEGKPIQALVSTDLYHPSTHQHQQQQQSSKPPILLVLPGKGKSRAGILSVVELLVSGLERGSALYHVQQASKRGWSIVLLDPNASGKTEGSVLIRWSLDCLATVIQDRPLYLLAHSAAGGYLVQYLLQGKFRQELLSSIQRLAFTDSTHNVQWARDDPPVERFLQSQRVLYIRNCSENPSDTFSKHKHKKTGELHEGDKWWQRRFGNIRTVWAGTTSHSAMCWVARHVIWDFFNEIKAVEAEPVELEENTGSNPADGATTGNIHTATIEKENFTVEEAISSHHIVKGEELSPPMLATPGAPSNVASVEVPKENVMLLDYPSPLASPKMESSDATSPKGALSVQTGDDLSLLNQNGNKADHISLSTWILRACSMAFALVVVVLSFLVLKE